jgi:DNA polymerase-2
MTALTGWLLDVYDDPQDGVVVWLLGDDGQRHRLRQDFPVAFYAAGPSGDLRRLWRFLEEQAAPTRLSVGPSSPGGAPESAALSQEGGSSLAPFTIQLSRQERKDLFCADPVTVLACQVSQPAALPKLFNQAAQRFPDLVYYDADIPTALRYAAVYRVFPLARCRVELAPDRQVGAQDTIQGLEALDTPWELDPAPPPLRTLTLEPDKAPSHGEPKSIAIRIGLDGASPGPVVYRLPLSPARPFLVNLRAILRRHDPDLLLSTYGDTWLFPLLLRMSRQCGLPLPLNREARRGVAHRKERTYFSYGRVIHRGQQFHLFGRWHIDSCNAMLFHDYGMDGVKELGRVSALPMQTVARVSPGTGISAMQILTALRLEVLVPWHKQQAERPKTALDLLRADQGGMVYQPIVGLHPHVAEVDFISMYPSIMAHFNISPETVNMIGQNLAHADQKPVNELNFGISAERGLVPQTLEPLLDKRLKLKEKLATLPGWDPRRKAYTAQASAHKWLLVTCFGYLGYKNARFGRIESHEAVTAYGREALLTAKEAAEDLGGTVLHMYVDGLWVRRQGFATPQDFQPMVEEIAARTGLPIALDGVYRWVAFLPSRVDERVPVANRYFGVFQDGSLKMRGIEARREDTPAFIARLQVEMLERLARLPDPGPAVTPEGMRSLLLQAMPGLVVLLRRRLYDLRLGRIPLEELLVAQRLSRALDEYKSPSPAARAAAQLAAAGKPLRAGQRVRFLITLGEPGVHAWDLPQPVNPAVLDLRRYAELTLRAAASVVQPLGVTEEALKDWVLEDVVRLPLPGKQLSLIGYR